MTFPLRRPLTEGEYKVQYAPAPVTWDKFAARECQVDVMVACEHDKVSFQNQRS